MKGQASTEMVEGVTSLINGANGSVDSMWLADGYFHRGLNLSVRGGMAKTRPRFVRLASLGSGTCLGAYSYRRNSSDRLVCVIGGDVIVLDMETLSRSSIPGALPSGGQAHFVKADRFCVVQNGTDNPVILDGNDVIDEYIDGDAANGKYAEKFPKGTLAAYGHGRIFMRPTVVPDNAGNPTAEDGRPYFIASDIVKPYRPKDVLRWTETNYLNEGGAFGLPLEMGFVHALAFFRNAQTSTGIGTLLVLARDGAGSFGVNIPRTQWKNQDLSQVLFGNAGTLSNVVIPVNDDLYFRGLDGLRSIRYTTSLVAGGSGVLSNVPLSSEVKYLTDMDTEEDLAHFSGALADNRLLFTTAGRRGGMWGGVVSLDSNTSATITSMRSNPAYDGLWTGPKIHSVHLLRVNGKDQHVFVVSYGGAIEAWGLSDSAITDPGGERPLCRCYTKSAFFKDPFTIKQLQRIDLWLQDVLGDVDVTAFYRPHGYPYWSPCSTAKIRAGTSRGHTRYKVRLTPLDDGQSDPANETLTVQAYSFDLCIQWAGTATMQSAAFISHRREDPQPDTYGEDAVVTELSKPAGQFELDDVSDYSVTG